MPRAPKARWSREWLVGRPTPACLSTLSSAETAPISTRCPRSGSSPWWRLAIPLACGPPARSSLNRPANVQFAQLVPLP